MANASTHWSRTGESGTLLGMRILLLIYRLLGRRGFRIVLLPVMLYFYLTNAQARQASRQYLSRMARFSARWPELDSLANSYHHFVSFGESLLDKLLIWMDELDVDQVALVNSKEFEVIKNSGQGGLIIVSHLGNIELCSALAHRLPWLRLTVLVYTQHAVKFNRLLNRVNDSAQVKLLQVTEMTPATAMLLAERIEAGELVVIAGDRTPVNGQQRTSYVSFLGEQARFPQGPMILSGLLRCPVYLMFCLKQPQGYKVYLESFAEQLRLPRKERDQYLQQQVQRYATALERYCQIEPLQWFNFFPFWDNPAAERQHRASLQDHL